MHSDFRRSSRPKARVEVILDGELVVLPALRSSVAAIRSYLERKALEKQRILCAFYVDGRSFWTAESLHQVKTFERVEAKSIDLAQVPCQLLVTARQQLVQARERVAAAVEMVLINSSRQAREYWWDLARDLKQPLVTLSLIPSSFGAVPDGSSSLIESRRRQLEELAAILKEVDQTCWSADSLPLSNALENRVLPWLDSLRDMLDLWHEALTINRPAAT